MMVHLIHSSITGALFSMTLNSVVLSTLDVVFVWMIAVSTCSVSEKLTEVDITSTLIGTVVILVLVVLDFVDLFVVAVCVTCPLGIGLEEVNGISLYTKKERVK
jgi:hypothetical protein